MNFQTKNKNENEKRKNNDNTTNLAHNISIVNKQSNINKIAREVIKSVTDIKISVLLLNFITLKIIQ